MGVNNGVIPTRATAVRNPGSAGIPIQCHCYHEGKVFENEDRQHGGNDTTKPNDLPDIRITPACGSKDLHTNRPAIHSQGDWLGWGDADRGPGGCRLL